jgi:regulator of cell morphogenesis and NO signaling
MTNLAVRTLGDLVATHPGAARVLERARLDYCCRGQRSLADACAAAGIDVDAVTAEIEALTLGAAPAWTALSPPALADHIVATHHEYLWDELSLLDELSVKVARVHGSRHPELIRVRDLVSDLRTDLEPHLLKEEQVLFPAIRELIDSGRRDFPFGSIANPIRAMASEHDRTGELLDELSNATDRYTVPADACASYRSLYERLAELERDTHTHIHKENHVLFPAALGTVGSTV